MSQSTASSEPAQQIHESSKEKMVSSNTDPKQESTGSVDRLARKLHIPESFRPSLTDRRQWKNFIRCMLVTLGSMVVMLAQSSLNKIGQAAFFGALMSQMLPPSMALSIYLFALLTLLIGLCFGWAWGIAGMAAAIRARDQVLLQQQVQREQSTYDTTANIEAQYQASIFRGAFLDPRASTVFGVFLFVGAYFLGFVRATKPRLTLGCIFGTIIMDLMCSFGPLFPLPVYTLAKTLLIPAGCFIGIALASIFLIFPQTLNHIMLDSITTKMLGPTIQLLKIQSQVVTTSPQDTDKWHELATKSFELRAGHIAGTTALEGQTALLQLEITRGQIGPGDLQKVFAKVKNLGLRAYGLASFSMVVDEQHRSFKATMEDTTSHSIVRTKAHVDRMKKHIDDTHSLTGLLPILADSTADLRQSSIKALDDLSEWLLLVNHTRWKKKPADAPTIAQREDNLNGVKEALRQFRETKHFDMLEPYKDSFDPPTGQLKDHLVEKYRYSSRDLFRCFVFTSTLIAFAIDLIELLELLLQIEKDNPKSKIQLPNAFTKNVVKSANEKGGGNPLDMGTSDNSTLDINDRIEEDDHDDQRSETSTAVEKKQDPKKEKKVKSHKKDPDAEDPRNAFQRFGRSIYHLWQGLTGPSGLFALKYALVSVALWIPAVCPSSAYFTYTNRGLWALIMAQTGLGVFTGEQILQFALRMSGTVAGLVLGMLAWYIGSGHGTGNPYGVAAATMVLIAPCLFIRIAVPIEKAAFFLMTNVTLMFVVGYSWVDEHTYQTANQGSGAGLAGRRALLVIIGFTAAFIIMLFPRPVSARALFRKRLAKNMADIGDLYGKVVTGIEGEMDHDNAESDVEDKGKIAEVRRERYKGGFMKVLGRIMGMQPQLIYASVEPGLRGPWPKAKYEALFKTQSQILSTLALLSSAYSRMDIRWCKRLASRSELMHPSFIADCLSMFSILQQSLRTGDSLPPMIPIFERLAIHRSALLGPSGQKKTILSHTDKQNGDGQSDQDGGDDGGPIDTGMEMATRDAQNVLQGVISWDTIHDEQIALFATANIALVHIAVGLNEMFRIVRSLVGEKELQGLDRASERWARGELGMNQDRV
ncbi:uncharacterized protein I303_100999 [Kwoniella dejecticola CBS 10117]|uniref:ER transporter 6TM N-terminal domain-containing protein n=1 Tax=Kwoniella dejecticola CBS 10117 TaxID=1296121 RepID=A0A1A6AGI3_9TREE|nr:uncharacterized protein I303_01003 [Kwoniella dejecticola CBS 10117]OBR89179.1 hypothetical protein I303_01003 [Kwoniella dejecticola CBS 10117]